jgi:hypothetical protein
MTTGISVGRRARLNINDSSVCIGTFKPKFFREVVTNIDGHICGDLDPPVENITRGRQMIMAQMTFDITEPLLDLVLPLLGITDLGGDAYELGATDDVVSFSITADMVGTIHALSNCYTASFGFIGQKGDRPSRLIWNVIGSSEAETGTFTPDPIDFGKPFAFTHTTCTISGTGLNTARPIDRFQIFVDCNLVTEHNNSITLTDATPGDRRAVFATSVPYTSSHDDLHWVIRDDDGGKQAVIVLNNGTKTVTFTMPRGIGQGETGEVEGKANQIRTPVSFNLFRYDNSGTRVSPLHIAITDS